jgi:hypothetical protein
MFSAGSGGLASAAPRPFNGIAEAEGAASPPKAMHKAKGTMRVVFMALSKNVQRFHAGVQARNLPQRG